jgi:membrane fusion protein (multidrug efflux system)
MSKEPCRLTPIERLLSALALLAAVPLALAGVSCRQEATPAAAGGAFAVQAIVGQVQSQSISETLSLIGTLAANEIVDIKSETDGAVAEIPFQEGQLVKAGDLLLRLDEAKASAALDEAEANLKLSRATYERSRQLFQDKLISQQEFDQAAAQFQANEASVALRRRELKDSRIVAPFEGVVSARLVSPGQVISKNTTLTWLVDLDPIKVELSVPERFVSQLQLGQKLAITVATYPGRAFSGEVYFVAPFIDATNRTAFVKARVPNPQHELKPGMFANLDLTLRLKEHAIVIPESSLMATGDRTMVYVLDKENTAQVRPVKIGLRQAGVVEIVEGLKAGERIVVEGIQKVRPGGKVAPSPTPALGSPGTDNEKPAP